MRLRVVGRLKPAEFWRARGRDGGADGLGLVVTIDPAELRRARVV
jgi:hypothetical protein